MEKQVNLDLGCGRNKKKGYIGFDISEDSDADYKGFNLGTQKLPFDDFTVDNIHAAHIMEHLTDEQVIFCMNECYRVLKWNGGDPNSNLGWGRMFIHVPLFPSKSSIKDPTHKKYWIEESIEFFCGWYIAKYRLDYGINCMFDLFKKRATVPKGRTKEECQMMMFGLAKDRNVYDEYIKVFPFNLPKKERGKSVPNLSFPAVKQTDRKARKDRNDPLWFLDTSWRTKHNVQFSNELKQVAKKMINEQMPEILKIKVDASLRYGENTLPLGLKGLFADLNRKHERLRQWLWEGKRDTSESIVETLRDAAIYNILGIMALESRKVNTLAGIKEDEDAN